mgnify:CR=1 FL=1
MNIYNIIRKDNNRGFDFCQQKSKKDDSYFKYIYIRQNLFKVAGSFQLLAFFSQNDTDDLSILRVIISAL